MLSRGELMARVRSTDTKPELAVRSLVHRMGYRFRLNRRDLPGTPDLTFPRLRIVIFVHGCFWHQHRCPRGARQPRSNTEYWFPKLQRNMERDRRSVRALRRVGWRVLVVWECQIRDSARLRERLIVFFESAHRGESPPSRREQSC